MKKKIGLIGIGNRPFPKNFKNSNWDGWIENLKHSNDFKIVSISDNNIEQLDKFRKKSDIKNIKLYTSTNKMLNENKMDAVIICSPAKNHLKDIKICLKKNIKILIEKPCVQTVKQAKEIISLKKNNLISVVQNWRFKDNSIIIKKNLDKKKIGRIGQIFFRYLRNREKIKYSNYIYKEKYPTLYAMGSHHIDLFRFILQDEITKVHCLSFKPFWSKYKYDTSQSVLLITKKGTYISYTTTFSSKNEDIAQESMIIEGKKGYIYNDSDWFEPPVFLFKKKKIELTKHIKKALRSIRAQNNISDKRILNNFAKFVNNEKSDHTKFIDSVRSIAVLEAIIKSVKLKKMVIVEKI